MKPENEAGTLVAVRTSRFAFNGKQGPALSVVTLSTPPIIILARSWFFLNLA